MDPKEKDAAFILSEDLGMALHLPVQDDDDICQQNTVLITVIGALFAKQDEEFFELLDKKHDELLAGDQ